MGGGASSHAKSKETSREDSVKSSPPPVKVEICESAIGSKEAENKSSPALIPLIASPNPGEILTNSKLKKMALGIPGYKDQQRDYDSTLSQLELNRTVQVQWSEPKLDPQLTPHKTLENKFSSPQLVNPSSSIVLSPHDKKKLKELAAPDFSSHSASFENLPRGSGLVMPPAGIPVRPFPKDRLKTPTNENHDSSIHHNQPIPIGVRPQGMHPFVVSPHPMPQQTFPNSGQSPGGPKVISFPAAIPAPLPGQPPPRIVVMSPANGAIPMNQVAARPPPSSAPVPVVKETTNVKRNKVQLPTKFSHAKPTTGDWLNKRYIVNNYILLDTLGAGSYGEVRLCKDRVTDKLFAIKIISKEFLRKKKNGKTSETYFEDIKREIAIMKKLLHPNILRLYEVLDDPKVNKMYLVLEYMKRGDLINVLKKRTEEEKKLASANNPSGVSSSDDILSQFSPLSDLDLWHIFRQIVSGIRYLHFQNIIHGDIKPQNLLLGEDGIVKVADFGISQMLSGSGEKLADAGGTPAFMAPELCDNKSFSGQLADIWAIGATIFMLKFGHPPFVAKNIVNLYYKICNDPLQFPAPIDPGLKNLLEGLLEKDPEKRMNMSHIVAHPWFRFPPSSLPKMPMKNVPFSRTNDSGALNVAISKSDDRQLPYSLGSKSEEVKPQNNDLSFQPPPTYDAEEEAAMRGPIHSATINDVYMSIGGIRRMSDSNVEVEGVNYENAIVDIDEDIDDDDEEEDEEGMKTVPMSNMKEGAKPFRKPSLNLSEKNSDLELPSETKEVEDVKEESTDMMQTNWGDDVFGIVDDVNDDEEEDEDEENDEKEEKDKVDMGHDPENFTLPGSLARHNEMTAEEEMRRSKQFLKKNAQKKSQKDVRSLDSSRSSKSSTSQSVPQLSSPLRQPHSRDNSSGPMTPNSLSNAPTPSHSIQKRFFPPSKENSSKFSSRENNHSRVSLLSNYDLDEEPEQLSNEEFLKLMDTLGQQPSRATHLIHKSYDPDDYDESVASDEEKRDRPNTTSKRVATSEPLSNLLEFLHAPLMNTKNEVGGAIHSEQGRRASQEDRYVVQINLLDYFLQHHLLEKYYDSIPNIRDYLAQISFAAVFDGHNGARASQYLSQQFLKRLIEDEACFDLKHFEAALKNTFLLLDYEVIKLLHVDEDPSGSTGVVVWYDGKRNVLTVAGVGDSLCVLSRNGRAIIMNKMHRLDITSEKSRVREKGGTVINNRVNGVLAVSRAFGDIQFKSLDHLTGEGKSATSSSSNRAEEIAKAVQVESESLVTAEPDIRSEVITPKTEFAIIASDGIWDVISPAAAVKFVRNRLLIHKDLQKAAKELTEEALVNQSVDNITVIILTFHTSFTSIPDNGTKTTNH